VIEIDIKTSAKVKGLKKYILEKIDLFKKVNVLLYKKNEQQSTQINSSALNTWVEMNSNDMEQPVKSF